MDFGGGGICLCLGAVVGGAENDQMKNKGAADDCRRLGLERESAAG